MMYLQKVISKNHIQKFLSLPDKIYSGDSNYIRPLDADVESIFDENTNALFQKGKCWRWLLLDSNHQVIGRIAAFFTFDNQNFTGGIGFFECIDSQAAADYMFTHCKNWLQTFGVKQIFGPVNFGERLKFWGLLADGFVQPLYGMNYNPPYYKTLFENYGFQISYEQSCYSLDLKIKLPHKFYKLSNVFTTNSSSYKVCSYRKIYLERFAKDFTTIYNKAWSSHSENKVLDEVEVVKLFTKMNAVIDEKVIWFVYHQEKPIGCWINLPNLNDYFKKLDPGLGTISILKLLFLKKWRPTKHLVGLIFGIIPEYQNKGIEAYLIVNALKAINEKKHYNYYEIQWVGSFNPKMSNMISHMNGKLTRKLITYQYPT